MRLPFKKKCSDCQQGWAYPATTRSLLPPAMSKDGFHLLCPRCLEKRLAELQKS